MGMHRLPTNNSDFLKVSGVGFTKLTKYGHEQWFNCWDKMNNLLHPSEVSYLDKKQVTLNVFSELIKATRN